MDCTKSFFEYLFLGCSDATISGERLGTDLSVENLKKTNTSNKIRISLLTNLKYMCTLWRKSSKRRNYENIIYIPTYIFTMPFSFGISKLLLEPLPLFCLSCYNTFYSQYLSQASTLFTSMYYFPSHTSVLTTS